MPNFMRPANREESLKFFNEHPSNMSIMINDGTGDYVRKVEYYAMRNKFRDMLYDLQEKLNNVTSDMKSDIEIALEEFQ